MQLKHLPPQDPWERAHRGDPTWTEPTGGAAQTRTDGVGATPPTSAGAATAAGPLPGSGAPSGQSAQTAAVLSHWAEGGPSTQGHGDTRRDEGQPASVPQCIVAMNRYLAQLRKGGGDRSEILKQIYSLAASRPEIKFPELEQTIQGLMRDLERQRAQERRRAARAGGNPAQATGQAPQKGPIRHTILDEELRQFIDTNSKDDANVILNEVPLRSQYSTGCCGHFAVGMVEDFWHGKEKDHKRAELTGSGVDAETAERQARAHAHRVTPTHRAHRGEDAEQVWRGYGRLDDETMFDLNHVRGPNATTPSDRRYIQEVAAEAGLTPYQGLDFSDPNPVTRRDDRPDRQGIGPMPQAEWANRKGFTSTVGFMGDLRFVAEVARELGYRAGLHEGASLADLLRILDAGHPVIFLQGRGHGGDGHYYVIEGYFTQKGGEHDGKIMLIERDGLLAVSSKHGRHGTLTQGAFEHNDGASSFFDTYQDEADETKALAAEDVSGMTPTLDEVMPWRTQEQVLSDPARVQRFRSSSFRYTLGGASSLLELVPQNGRDELTETAGLTELTMERVWIERLRALHSYRALRDQRHLPQK